MHAKGEARKHQEEGNTVDADNRIEDVNELRELVWLVALVVSKEIAHGLCSLRE